MLLHLSIMFPTVPAVVIGTEPIWHILIGPVILWLIIAVIWGQQVSCATPPFGTTGAPRAPDALEVLRHAADRRQYLGAAVIRASLAAGMLIPGRARTCGRQLRQSPRWQSNCSRSAPASTCGRGRLADFTAALKSCGFPEQAVALLSNGEFSGRLEEVLLQVATLADDSASVRARSHAPPKIFTGTIYFISILVAVIAISLDGDEVLHPDHPRCDEGLP